MPKLTLHQFDGGNQELQQVFCSLRETLRYQFSEDSYPDDATFFMVMHNGTPAARAAVIPNLLMPPETDERSGRETVSPDDEAEQANSRATIQMQVVIRDQNCVFPKYAGIVPPLVMWLKNTLTGNLRNGTPHLS